MTPHERLAAHQKTRPEMPRPLPPVESPVYKKWRKEMDAWIETKTDIVREIEVPVLDFERQVPSVVPASDETYVPRMRGRKRAPKGVRR